MRKTVSCLTVALVLYCFSATTAQDEARPPATGDKESTSRFQVESGLVEVRAIVTDKEGRIVEGLRKEDFVLYEDKQPQEISHFTVSKIENGPAGISGDQKGLADEESRLRRAVERLSQPPVRTVLLYVDTLHLSFESLNWVKQALFRFIDEQLTDQDLIAFATSDTLGVAQQFTRDRKVLRYAVEQMRYSPGNRDTLFTPFLAADFLNDDLQAVRFGIDLMRREDRMVCPCTRLKTRAYHKATQVLGDASFSRETAFAIIESYLEQMRDLPGKRMAVMVSDGFTLFDRIGNRQIDAIHRVAGRAVRSGAVIYTIDAKGLRPPLSLDVAIPSEVVDPVFENLVECLKECSLIEDEDDQADCNDACVSSYPVSLECLQDIGTFDQFVCQKTEPGELDAYLNSSAVEQTDGLYSLAAESGGKMYENSNDIGLSLKQALADNRFFYVLSYYIKEDKDPERFRYLDVRIPAHPEYGVKAPRGFWISSLDEKVEAATPQEQLIQAIKRPLPVTDLGVSARADFVEYDGDENQLSLGVYFEGDRFQYRDEDRSSVVELEIMSFIYDASGKQVDGISARVTGTLNREGLEQARTGGYRFSRRLALQPGVYQARIGVREEGTDRMGTATTWVEIPEITPDKLEMSSLVLANPLDEGILDEKGMGVGDLEQIKMIQGVPMYAPEDIFYYAYRLHPSRQSGADPKVSARREVMQAGKPVMTEEWQPLSAEYKRADGKGWLDFDGELDIGRLAPGVYELEISVRESGLETTVQRSVVFGIL